MKPPSFDYVAARSVEEAVALLRERDDAKLLAGGQSLTPMLNFRLLAPDLLIDIGRIPGLKEITETADGVAIAAAATHRAVAEAPAVRRRFPILPAVIAHIAHLAIRNRGAFCGSLAHADPAAEAPMLAVLLNATLHVQGPDGAREIAAQDFFEAPLTTVLEEDEMLISAFLPDLPANAGWGFEETARRAGDFALAGAGAVLTAEAGVIGEARIALLGVDDTPRRATAAEALLSGARYDPGLRDAAAEAVRDAVDPMDDLHASADFRRHLAGVMAARALDAAWAKLS